MRDIRKKEKAIESESEMRSILGKARYITIAMCEDNEPYLVTLSHGYDASQNCLYFHCADKGKKIDINPFSDVQLEIFRRGGLLVRKCKE